MRNIILPNRELRLLSNQLQSFNAGYTVPQIRSLDKVVRTIETVLAPFEDGLAKIQSVIVSEVTPEEKKAGQAKKDAELDTYFETEGKKTITCPIEDQDFEFIKQTWARVSTFNGSPQAREAILKIDDALAQATSGVFTNHEADLKPVDKPLTN